MPDKEIEFLARRLRAVSRISLELERAGQSPFDLESICEVFVNTAGYSGCYIITADESGGVRSLSQYYSPFIEGEWAQLSDAEAAEYLKKCAESRRDYLVNQDPLLARLPVKKINEESLNTLTLKLQYSSFIYGFITFFLAGNYKTIKKERIILTELVRTISFFLHEIDYRQRINVFLRTSFETTGSATALIDEKTRIIYANRELEELSGYNKSEIEGKMSFADFIHDGDVDMMVRYHNLRRTDPAAAPRNYECRLIDREGELKHIYMTVDMVPHTGLSIGSFSNVSDRKRLESEVLRISEIERLQIGSDLHDGLGPHLAGIRYMLGGIKNDAAAGRTPSLAAVEEIEKQLADAIAHTKTLTKGLMPVDIQPDGLAYALQDLAENIRSVFNVKCSFDLEGEVQIDKNITATHLYYIAREALNNAVKHAAPQNIKLVLKNTREAIVLIVVDDGVGIPKMLDNEKGMGINIMKYRANIINSEITIDKNSAGGTTVRCSLKKNRTGDR